MTNDSIERQLRQLGTEWTVDKSFVNTVMSSVNDEGEHPRESIGSRRRMARLSYLTACIIVMCALLWWALGPQSTGSRLYANMMDALGQVQSIHTVASVRDANGVMHQIMETWFARGQGFLVQREDLIRVDNGAYFWEHRPGSSTATRTRSVGNDEFLEQALSFRDEFLRELKQQCERHPEGDRAIDGVDHTCYMMTFHGTSQPADPKVLELEKRRTLIFVHPRWLPTLIESQQKIDGVWTVRMTRTWEYDVAVDRDIFSPDFDSDVRVIDADAGFDRLAAVETAIHSQRRDGLIYAIHQARRFEGGGVLVVSSVRGTDETLKNYPLTSRMLQPGLYITDGPATNYEASPQGADHFRLRLARANQHGIDLEWWMMVPRGRKPNWFEDEQGRVQLKLGITPRGEYGKAKHADERGVIHHIYWDLSLDIPTPDQLPTLDEIATQVHFEVSTLSTTPAIHLNMGVAEVNEILTQQFGTTDEVSPEEFATATRGHLSWWQLNDVDFQIKQGRSGARHEIGPGRMKPAVMVDHYSVFDDVALAKAAGRNDLMIISARGTAITDVGLATLASLPHLMQLNVAETSITDAGLRHLESIESLRTLNVKDTNVTQSGIDRLKEALPGIEIITAGANQASDGENPTNGDGPTLLPERVKGTIVDPIGKPIVGAMVTVLIRRFSKKADGELPGPGPWSAITDKQGRYTIQPSGTIRRNIDEVRIKVVADGFADVSDRDYKRRILEGSLPQVSMTPGRKIRGRLVDPTGAPVARSVVRFQSCSETMSVIWNSGPFAVETDGTFSLSIPSVGDTTATIYPEQYAPRFFDVTTKTDQSDIALEQGTVRKGQVVDRQGNGIPNAVVGIRKTEYRVVHACMTVIGTAIRTDDQGYFQLPPLSGSYELSVAASLADYSRQMMLTSEPPPQIDPITIEFNSDTPPDLILLRERAP